MNKFLTLLIVSAVICATNAKAGDTYVSGSFGAGLSDNFSGDGSKASFEADPDYGYAAAAAIGTNVDALPGVRVEMEASWRHNGLGGELIRCKKSYDLNGSDGTFATMINASYGGVVYGFRPYVMAGAGYGFRRIVLEPTPDNWLTTSSSTERASFVWQAGAGVDYPISEDVSVGIGYRYFVAPAIDRVAIFGGKSTFFEASGDNHAVMASLTVNLH